MATSLLKWLEGQDVARWRLKIELLCDTYPTSDEQRISIATYHWEEEVLSKVYEFSF